MSRAPAPVRAVRAARDLVDLVDEDDPALRRLHVLVGLEEQLGRHHLDVLAVVAGLGVLGGVDDGEGDLEALGQVPGDVRLAAAGGADHQDVRLLEDRLLAAGGAQRAALEVVVGGDRHHALGALLADDEPVEVVEDLARRHHRRVAVERTGAGFQGRVLPRPGVQGIVARSTRVRQKRSPGKASPGGRVDPGGGRPADLPKSPGGKLIGRKRLRPLVPWFSSG
jgi:hypothetical protein